MVPTWLVCLGVLLLRGSVEGQSSSLSSSGSGLPPVTFTHTTGHAQAAATSGGIHPLLLPQQVLHRLARQTDTKGFSSSFSSSSSVPGQAPLTYTYTSGNAQAAASSASPQPQPIIQYYQVRPPSSRRKRAFSSSYSSSTPGQPPVTLTYTSGNAQAVASAANPQAYYYYVVPPVAPHRLRRQLIRNDATQQIYQRGRPPGLTSSLRSGLAFDSPPLLSSPVHTSYFRRNDAVQQIFQNKPPLGLGFAPPPSFSAPAGISQSQASTFHQLDPTSRKGRFSQIGRFVYGPPAREAGKFAVPHPAYGAPVESSEGADASVLTLHVPHRVYGVPPQFTLASTEADVVSKNYIFVPAFPNGRPSGGVEFSPPAIGGFVPPDGALLSPPAPVVNNLPIPSPRQPIKSYNILFPKQ